MNLYIYIAGYIGPENDARLLRSFRILRDVNNLQNPLTFHCTGCFIGILKMVYYIESPHKWVV